ncbi:XdhC family protein [Halomonas beimenensis]|uniref:Xanthine and CO dehydrogenases maturation factor, XdhC/CoxF family n=1 Tax=Halomonas beimenensis TaxID=475662 RepID=A0A291P6G4_9GAMM|nr:XdhC family protein [Halomonas beimenensis]ATJ82439.1 xanthine and CO dehydrogenases maturation factor, XdhC/CoxF family [Halomonas beimenensis]
MRALDVEVVEAARRWHAAGHDLWWCTVLSTFGSAPREPGALLVARADGRHVGSLSGGCVEEDFLARLDGGAFRAPAQIAVYGDGADALGGERVRLPCDGRLEVLIEHWPADATHLEVARELDAYAEALRVGQPRARRLALGDGRSRWAAAEATGPRVERDEETVRIRVGPAARLLIAGISPVAQYCVQFARALGFEVVVCDPRPEAWDGFEAGDARCLRELPSEFLRREGAHRATAVVALTHDPRLDDLTMLEAVRGEAFYIGVMGSKRTSEKRAERLRRTGGLDEQALGRIRMPIGLDLGSKTPAEIALATLADVVRVMRGR